MKGRILIIDDDPGIIKVVTAGLKNNGYEVLAASDGYKGIEMAKEHNPDLIIMDIMMPHLQGGDAVRLLKSGISTKHIPVIFLTAVLANMPQGTDVNTVNVDGEFFKVIAKPFELENLLSQIGKLTGDR